MIASEDQPANTINSVSCDITGAYDFDRGIARKIILPGEITGVRTYAGILRGGIANKYLPEKDEQRILIFTEGSGSVIQDRINLVIDELALFVPDMNNDFMLASGKEGLSYLEIMMHLNAEDLSCLGEREDKFPYFVRYSDCRRYGDDAHSSKTVSKIILPEDIVPRLCIGSVRTAGPDEVREHSHPMLEQLFLGLAGNDITVKADSSEIPFRGNDLLHIPLGSNHGTKVGAGKEMHYIWIDFFHSMEDMDYITNTHLLKDD